ncbi:DUF1127 domain-containing protein [Aurantimonas sp. VKM B-3413]|nr:DUF1127 domain-containing protein [Aurantimonas sp. VKM B-3413]MCB8837583.1 DUF1127 domain-containing protein [Aurantimonas sp. VKM B-3413]
MFRRFANRINSFRTVRNHIRELQMMDDRELADIGVERASISRAVRYGRR